MHFMSTHVSQVNLRFFNPGLTHPYEGFVNASLPHRMGSLCRSWKKNMTTLKSESWSFFFMLKNIRNDFKHCDFFLKTQSRRWFIFLEFWTFSSKKKRTFNPDYDTCFPFFYYPPKPDWSDGTIPTSVWSISRPSAHSKIYGEADWMSLPSITFKTDQKSYQPIELKRKKTPPPIFSSKKNLQCCFFLLL